MYLEHCGWLRTVWRGFRWCHVVSGALLFSSYERHTWKHVLIPRNILSQICRVKTKSFVLFLPLDIYENLSQKCQFSVAKNLLNPDSVSLNMKIVLNYLNFVFPIAVTAWKVSKYGVFSGPYFPAFGLNTEFFLVRISPYSVQMWENTDQKKLGIWALSTQWVKTKFE